MFIPRISHKKIIFSLIMICLASSLVMGFHHHADEGQHADCSICVAGNLFSACHIESNPAIDYYPLIVFLCRLDTTDRPAISSFPAFAPRAPPFSAPITHFA